MATAACLPFAVQFLSQLGSGPRHPARRLPWAVPDRFGLHHLVLRARPDHLRRMGATIYAVPTLVIMSWLILGQIPRWLAVAGGALYLAGVAVSRSQLLVLPEIRTCTPR